VGAILNVPARNPAACASERTVITSSAWTTGRLGRDVGRHEQSSQAVEGAGRHRQRAYGQSRAAVERPLEAHIVDHQVSDVSAAPTFSIIWGANRR